MAANATSANPYAGAISAALGVGLNIAGVLGGNKAIKARLQALRTNNSIIGDDTRRQMDMIDEQLSMKLTEGDIETVKAEARMKAGRAETGVSGKSTEYAMAQVFMDNAFDDAIIIEQGRMAKVDVARTNLARALGAIDREKAMVASQPSPLMQTLGLFQSAMSGYQSGLNLDYAIASTGGNG